MELLCIFIGGAIGALLRYCMYSQFETFYIPTFVVNMLGCFVIGFAAYLFGRGINNFSKCMKSLLTIGLAGGLTTFSTFTLDLYHFISIGNFWGSFIYLFVSVMLGLCLVSVGINCAYNLMVSLIKSRKGRKR